MAMNFALTGESDDRSSNYQQTDEERVIAPAGT